MSQLEAEETLSAGDVSTAAEADGEVTMPLEVKETAGRTAPRVARPGPAKEQPSGVNEQLLRMVQGEKQQHGAFDERLRSAHAHHCHLRATAPERRGSHLPASFRPHTPAALKGLTEDQQSAHMLK